MPEPIIVPSVEGPQWDHLELYLDTHDSSVSVWTEGPRGGIKATAVVSLADLKAAVVKLEPKEVCPQSDCEYQGKCEGDPQKGDYCPLPREAL